MSTQEYQQADAPTVVSVTTGWQRSARQSRDCETIHWREPLFIDNQNDHAKQAISFSSQCCGVCREHESRYTCPRCQLPYCSVACYKTHSTTTNSNDNTPTACTEAFYKNRVESILHLETKENKDSVRQMLNRNFQAVVEDDHWEDETNVSDELYELLIALENNDNGVVTDKSLLQKMSPALRYMLERDIQSGKLQELILKKWHPWWRQELINSAPEEHFETPDETLDERLLKVPRWETIRPKKSVQHDLAYNLIDILYAICWTLRLYHGISNAITNSDNNADEDDGSAVATTLWNASAVLGRDARYSSLEECLAACTAASTKVYHNNGCNTQWNALVEDCALLCQSPRLVGRALLEAQDIWTAAIKKWKKHHKGQNQEDVAVYLAKLRRVRKKTEFYLSFSQSLAPTELQRTSADLQDWTEHWLS